MRRCGLGVAFLLPLAFCNFVFASCESYERTETAPAGELFQVMLTCDLKTTHAKAIFMMIVGQVRGLVDMSSFPPAEESDNEILGKLYGTIYYRFGGLGPDVFYLDDAKYEKLIGYLESWEAGAAICAN